MQPRFEQFIRERQYLHNVTAATVEWYEYSFKWLPSESPSADELKNLVIRMREKGRKATGCNSVIRAVNAYLHWNAVGSDARCSPSCKHLRVSQLREPQIILPTLTEAQITRIVKWKPRQRNHCQCRLHLLTLILLDTGCRITEALTLRLADINMENLLVTLDGKGRKQRIVPFSFELRKALHHYVTDFKRKPDLLLLASRHETRLDRRVVLRDVKLLCERLGFDPPGRTLHSFRHTFAVNYLRRGGSVFHLQKVLGHSSLEMTKRYCNLVTADLSAVHERISLLAGR
ncbi:MAG: site-specific integrase [Terriglobales bacterium]|jgi:integrase/recombinase XerD